MTTTPITARVASFAAAFTVTLSLLAGVATMAAEPGSPVQLAQACSVQHTG